MNKIVLPAGLFIVLCASTAHAVSDYARRCAEVIGVPVPDVDCADPNGSEVPVVNKQGEQCDNPSHGLSNCNLGTRFIRYVDRFKRNGKDETVVTMIMCRRTNDDSRNSGVSSDIGVIQYNETKHAACWWSSTSSGQQPAKTIRVGGRERRVYPSPTSDFEPAFWQTKADGAPAETCIRCHQNGVWLRTPFAMSVPAEEAGKGYKRGDRSRPYGPGDGNGIPPSHGVVARRGLACSVGLRDWTQPDGVKAPRQVKIDGDAFDAKFPPGELAGRPAKPGRCTDCHYFGSGMGGMNCDAGRTGFLGEFKTGDYYKNRREAPFAAKHWMPPTPLGETPEGYLAKYVRSLDALSWCCKDENVSDPAYAGICLDKFPETPAAPCAQCADCMR